MKYTYVFILLFIINFMLPVFSAEQKMSEAEKHALQGLQMFQAGDLQGAEKELVKAIKLDGKNGDYKKVLGTVYIRLNKNDKALEQYLGALKIKPKDVELNYNIAFVYDYYKKEPSKAKPYYSKALSLDPKGMFAEAAYFYLGNIYFTEKNYEKSLAQYKGAAALKGTNQLMSTYNMAQCYIKLNKPEQAEKSLLEALKLAPSQPAIIGSLGDIYLKKKDYGKAIDKYNEAIKYDNNNYSYHVGLGKAYTAKNDIEGAIKEYNSAITLNGTDGETRYLLGSLYFQKKNYEEALIHLKKAAELDPKNKLYSQTLTSVQGKVNETESQKNSIRFVDSTIDSVYIDGKKLENNISTIYLGKEYDIEIIYKDGTALSGTLKLVDNDKTLEKGYKFGKISDTDRENARIGGSGTIYLKGSDDSRDVEIKWEGSTK